MAYARELAQALKAAQEAGAIQQSFQQRLPAIELKPDASPVTEVDRSCERVIRSMLLAEFPGDGFLGEETLPEKGTTKRQWIVDPLDGTRPYLRKIPTYSVLIALEEDGEPVVGVIHLPAMNITCWATKGDGAHLNGAPIHVSTVSSLKEAFGTGFGFRERADEAEGRRLFTLMRSWDYAYGFMDGYSYVCIASGRLDIAVNLLDKPWDCASAACIVREAGGTFSDIRGNPTVHGGSIILSNGLLHEAALGYFSDSGGAKGDYGAAGNVF